MPRILEHVGEYPCCSTSDVAAPPSSVADLLRRVVETGALRRGICPFEIVFSIPDDAAMVV
jgi:hypothetical protein